MQGIVVAERARPVVMPHPEKGMQARHRVPVVGADALRHRESVGFQESAERRVVEPVQHLHVAEVVIRLQADEVDVRRAGQFHVLIDADFLGGHQGVPPQERARDLAPRPDRPERQQREQQEARSFRAEPLCDGPVDGEQRHDDGRRRRPGQAESHAQLRHVGIVEEPGEDQRRGQREDDGPQTGPGHPARAATCGVDAAKNQLRRQENRSRRRHDRRERRGQLLRRKELEIAQHVRRERKRPRQRHHQPSPSPARFRLSAHGPFPPPIQRAAANIRSR